MAAPVQSEVFAEIHSTWPGRPYPLLVGHSGDGDERVCPAAALYALGKLHGDRLKALELAPGEIVACFPDTWFEWVGMMQACLRRGAAFAPAPPMDALDVEARCEAVGASVRLAPNDMERLGSGRRLEPNSWLVWDSMAVALAESEVIAATEPDRNHVLAGPEHPVWVDDDLPILPKTLGVMSLLREGTEIHVGLSYEEAKIRADENHRFLDPTSCPAFWSDESGT